MIRHFTFLCWWFGGARHTEDTLVFSSFALVNYDKAKRAESKRGGSRITDGRGRVFVCARLSPVCITPCDTDGWWKLHLFFPTDLRLFESYTKDNQGFFFFESFESLRQSPRMCPKSICMDKPRPLPVPTDSSCQNCRVETGKWFAVFIVNKVKEFNQIWNCYFFFVFNTHTKKIANHGK